METEELDGKLRRVAGELLNTAADKFSNHGCNDWRWPDYMTNEDRIVVSLLMVARNVRKPPGELTASQLEEASQIAEDGPADWLIMCFLADKLQGGKI